MYEIIIRGNLVRRFPLHEQRAAIEYAGALSLTTTARVLVYRVTLGAYTGETACLSAGYFLPISVEPTYTEAT